MGKKAEINITLAGKLMGKTPQYVRLGLQQGRLPFGDAVQKENGRWSYNIYPTKLFNYLGIDPVNIK